MVDYRQTENRYGSTTPATSQNNTTQRTKSEEPQQEGKTITIDVSKTANLVATSVISAIVTSYVGSKLKDE